MAEHFNSNPVLKFFTLTAELGYYYTIRPLSLLLLPCKCNIDWEKLHLKVFVFPGARAETAAKVSGNQGYENEGVRGLKALGVRDLNYRMAYLACTVTATNARVCWRSVVCIWNNSVFLAFVTSV